MAEPWTPVDYAVQVLKERRWLRAHKPKPVPPRIVRDRSGEQLFSIPAREYVERLAIVEFSEWGRISCPLPDHEDHSHDFSIIREDDGRWYCFGCNRGGDIYNFAAGLWGLDCRRDFREIHERLQREFG
jgi:hypothetical protein